MFETITKIRLFLNLLLILEIVIGLVIIAVTYFYQRILSTFLTETEGRMLSSKFFNVYILSFQLVASFLCGMSMWATVWPRRYSENIQLLLSVWLIFCFIIVACGCATIWTLLETSDTLSEGAEIVLIKGIDNYYMNPEWKLLWDKLQYTRECCGVHSYQDWMHASWLSDDCDQTQYSTTGCSLPYLDSEYNDLEESYQNYDVHQGPSSRNLDYQKILAPYACCKHNSTLCYKNYMPHMKTSGDSAPLPHLNLSDINIEGCFHLFCEYLTAALRILFILISLAVFIDILICCITRYLMATNYKRCYREFSNDSCMFDDEGNALVVIKCPPKVRCITLEEPNACSGSDIPNLASSTDFCPCYRDNADAEAGLDGCLKTNNENNIIVH